MAAKEDDGRSLNETFNKGWDCLRKIESDDRPSGCDEAQEAIAKAQSLFIQSTNMVNSLRLFSTNEELEEVSTQSIKYLLLPAFLGNLSLKQTVGDRTQHIQSSKVYFVDFLKRCTCYGLCDKKISEQLQQLDHSGSETKELSQMGSDRQSKIERYKESKRLSQAIEDLEDKLKSSTEAVDDEVQRSYYISWIKWWINQSLENLSLIKSEIEILNYMNNMKVSGKSQAQPPPVKRKPMKPVLITRDMVQAKVFGAGYPSLPTMTQEQYLEKEIAEGKVVLDYDASKQRQNGDVEEDERKSEDDSDSEEKLRKARAWDEFKDDHRKGEGNRYNRS